MMTAAAYFRRAQRPSGDGSGWGTTLGMKQSYCVDSGFPQAFLGAVSHLLPKAHLKADQRPDRLLVGAVLLIIVITALPADRAASVANQFGVNVPQTHPVLWWTPGAPSRAAMVFLE
jgi:hypothetical protein